MKTQDGYTLRDGDDCFVTIQCGPATHRLSPNPRPAVYRDEHAKENGWEFTFKKPLRGSCIASDCGCEVTSVWKYNPGKAN